MTEPERRAGPARAAVDPASPAPLPWTALWLAYLAALPLFVGLLAAVAHPMWVGLGAAAYLLPGLMRLQHIERRHAEEVPETRWRDIMPCYLSVQDRDLRILRVNTRFRDDFGDCVGETCYQAYKHRTSPCPGCPVLLTFADGGIHTGEETVTTRHGQLAHVVLTSAPVFDARGEIAAAMEMSTNISELKELQRQLERTRKDFQQLFDLVPCYISIQDRELRIQETNELFRRDFGEQRDHRCYRAYKDGEAPCEDCPVEKSFADGEIHSGEEVVVTRDGQRANVIVHSMPLRDEAGSITSVMEVSTNITEVKQLQHQLAMMGLAVASMAHRAKNILMGLEGGIFVVNEGFEAHDDDLVDEGWEMVQRNVEHVSRVVKDLLFCSKEREVTLQPGVSPAVVLHDVVELFHSRAEEQEIDLVLEIDDEDHTATLDPDGLHSLMVNLVANAVDACRFDVGGEAKRHLIAIGCARGPAGATVLRVRDNGAGIPEEARRKVFEGFFSTKGTEGTGLGLLVAQRIVQAHGGTIELESSEGVGTTFTITLPAQPVPDEAVPDEVAPDEPAPAAG